MTIALIKLIAIPLYAISLSMLWQGMFRHVPVNKQKLARFSYIASGVHLVGALLIIFPGAQVDLSIFASSSLIFALTSLIVTVSSIRKPVHAVLLIIQPIAIFLILMSLIFTPTKLTSLSTGVALHVLFSILSYGVITIAAASALIMTYASYKLKHKQMNSMGSLMPPLETIEKLLFEMLLAGTLLLAASIVSGFVFVEDFFGQYLAHKTFFSILSLIIFATLLSGHHFFGWRGSKAMKWTLSGFITLLLAYVGSKFVIELILG